MDRLDGLFFKNVFYVGVKPYCCSVKTQRENRSVFPDV